MDNKKEMKSGDIEITVRLIDDHMTIITQDGDVLEAQESNPMHWRNLYDCLLGIVSDSRGLLAGMNLAIESNIAVSPLMKMLEEHGFELNDDGSVSYPEEADSMYHVVFTRSGGKLVSTRPFRMAYDYNFPVLKRRTNIHDDVYNEVVEV